MTLEDLNSMLVSEGVLEIDPLPTAEEIIEQITGGQI